MKLQLYSNNSDNKKINKSLVTKGGAFGITLKKDTDVISPDLLITLPTGVNIQDVNYAYIDSFGYYYFITKKVKTLGGLYHITLDLDELYTFKSEILSNYAYITRSESNFNNYIIDSNVPLLSNVIVSDVNIGGFDKTKTRTYLTVVGADTDAS